MDCVLETETTTTWRWTPERFLRAWELGLFEGQRVQLIRGEVIRTMVIGDWHGTTTFRVVVALTAVDSAWEATGATLASLDSLPDPDCWLRRVGAEPTEALTPRLGRWAPLDVGLVVEVSDDSYAFDTTVKAEIYAGAGYPHYWVVHRGGIDAFSGPTSSGYATRRSQEAGDRIDVPYAPGHSLAVAELVGIDGA